MTGKTETEPRYSTDSADSLRRSTTEHRKSSNVEYGREGEISNHSPTQPLRERYRRRLGLSHKQWTLLISLLLVLPYPFFVYFIVSDIETHTAFLVVTLAYSVFAIYANYRL